MAMDLTGEMWSNVSKGFGDFIRVGGQIIPIVIGAGILVFIVWWMMEQKKYNKVVHVHRVGANDIRRHFFDKCKYVKNKDGVDGWRFKSMKMRANVPPDDCIEITTGGGVYAECVVDSNNQITWLTQSLKYNDWKRTKSYEPISTQSKANYAYEIDRNKRLRGASWKENIPMIVGGITLVLLVGVFMMFYPRIQEAQANAANGLAEASQSMERAMDKLDLIIENQQRIEGTYVPQSASNLREADIVP